VGPLPYLGAQSDYDVFDLSARWLWNDKTTIRLGVDNLFDEPPVITRGRNDLDPNPTTGQGTTEAGFYDILGRAVLRRDSGELLAVESQVPDIAIGASGGQPPAGSQGASGLRPAYAGNVMTTPSSVRSATPWKASLTCSNGGVAVMIACISTLPFSIAVMNRVVSRITFMPAICPP
jgi:hypothetical protein